MFVLHVSLLVWTSACLNILSKKTFKIGKEISRFLLHRVKVIQFTMATTSTLHATVLIIVRGTNELLNYIKLSYHLMQKFVILKFTYLNI